MEDAWLNLNHTTPHVPPPTPTPGSAALYALVSFMLLMLTGCVAAVVCYVRRRARLDELRHRLIPLYSYDPAEEEDDEWGGGAPAGEDEELTEPLWRDGKLAMSAAYGTLDVDLLGPGWLLVITAVLLAPPVLGGVDVLLCHHCPLQHRGPSCPHPSSTQCLPHQRCSTSTGSYGPVHVLSAQGCVDARLCGSKQNVSYRGVEYEVGYTCCCRDGCNTWPTSASSLKTLLQKMAKNHDLTDALAEQTVDSCVNYTNTA